MFQTLAAELAITMTDALVWVSIGEALILGGASLLLGVWLARKVGLLRSDAPAGETLGVGLACGLMVLTAWWAAFASGGRSSFTPVAIGFAIAIGLAVTRRTRSVAVSASPTTSSAEDNEGRTRSRGSDRRSILISAFASAVFLVGVALLYGSTMAPSPRDGIQPVEFNDEAYYSVLGADLATTGTETTYSPSGFSRLEGVPPQTWYHWGELWLASAVIKTFGTAPIPARYFVVLPVMLLAAAAMTGTVVRRLGRTESRRAYVFGVLVCLFLAPVPSIPGPFFSSWAVGMIFGITIYGLAAVAILLALYGLAVLRTRDGSWALGWFVGSGVAMILPAHLAVALLALCGVGSIWVIRVTESLIATRRLPVVSRAWRRALIATGTVLIATVAWGILTGHGIGPGVALNIPPFNPSWRDSVTITVIGGGAFFAIAVAWTLFRKEAPLQTDLFLGTGVILAVGAIAWGAQLGVFTMFYLFYAGIAVIATPIAAVAVWMVLQHLRSTQRMRLAVAVVVLCAVQLELGVATGILRLQQFGPRDKSTSVLLLEAIRQLPRDAKLAYACSPFEEHGFVGSTLLSIDAHTGRRVVPMCYEAEVLSVLIGLEPSLAVENAFFKWAPQRALYPTATAAPSSTEVAAFLKKSGINYIYADVKHPNSLVPNAVLITTSRGAQVLRIP